MTTPHNPSLSAAAQAEFCQVLLEHLRAGLPVGKALASLARDARSRRLRRVAARLHAEVVERGLSLSDAIDSVEAQGTPQSAFSAPLVALVRVGERTAGLADILELLVRQQSREARLCAVVRTTLLIPMGTAWMVTAALVGALLTIVPAMQKTYAELENNELADLTQAVVVLSNALFSYWYLFVVAATACVVWQWRLLYRPNFDGWVWRVLRRVPPFFAYYHCLNVMAFLGTAGGLLRRGLALPEALGLAGATLAGEQPRRDASLARAMIETGSSPDQAAWFLLFLPAEVRELLQSLPSGSEPGRAMEDLADFYDQRLEGMSHGFLRTLVPGVLVAAGLMLFFVLVFALYISFFTIGNVLR